MNRLKNLIDRVVFVVVSFVVLILLVFWRGCDMKIGGDPGTGQPDSTIQATDTPQDPDAVVKESNDPDEQQPSEPTEPSPVVKLFLGRKGVSEDQATWYDMADFAGYIKQLQDKGVKEVHYTLLDDSIERYEERWAEELKKANMRSYIQTDGM